jgi:hypothetical protein
MPTPRRPTGSRKPSPEAERRRALELLAASRDSCGEAVMPPYGFTIERPGYGRA